jgi:DNA-binding transcriptional LysR family regulator
MQCNTWTQLPRSERILQRDGYTLDVWRVGSFVRFAVMGPDGRYIANGIRPTVEAAKAAALEVHAREGKGQTIADEFCQSYWLRDAIAALAKRDPIDAIQDVESLLRVQQERLNDIQRFGADVNRAAGNGQ